MVEVCRPGNVLNIDGEFQRLMPIQARRNWSDFLELTPGIISRGFDDGSGRQVYFGHGTEHFAHVLQLEGMIASNYHDAQVTYVAMGTDMIEDVQVKTGGVDASSPMGVGHGDERDHQERRQRFNGSAALRLPAVRLERQQRRQLLEFVTCNPSGTGTPTTAYVRQFDASLAGRLTDSLWFFGSLRRACRKPVSAGPLSKWSGSRRSSLVASCSTMRLGVGSRT